MDDETLVRMAVLGREQAVVDLYRKYIKPVYRFFYFQVNQNRELAEDLTSQTFLDVIRSLKNFEGKGKFVSYLYGIARRELMDHLRKKYKEPTLPLFESLSIGEEILDEEVMEEKILKIEGLLQKLEDREQKAIKMRYLEGASSQEIADKLEVNLGNAKVIVHRAIKKLAKMQM